MSVDSGQKYKFLRHPIRINTRSRFRLHRVTLLVKAAWPDLSPVVRYNNHVELVGDTNNKREAE